MKCSLDCERDLHRQGFSRVVGIDEAGRGPLAGPVVAAGVVLPEGFHHDELDDSKKLTASRRASLYAELTDRADIQWAVAVVEAEEVDRLNILKATHVAMRRALAGLVPDPDHALIDGLPVLPFPIPQTALVGGDGLSFSIAAASVIAKVTRDRIMVAMDVRYPGYEFAQHKGYGTALHLAKLRAHGPCAIHRRSFSPVRQAVLPLV
jgi:ribonuclease HII